MWSFFMRRIYVMNARRKQIVQEAILQMRATREALGPEFMDRIRMLVRNVDPASLLPDQPFSADPHESDEERVDRRKNLLVIMKFLQLKGQDKDFQNQVRALLSESKTPGDC